LTVEREGKKMSGGRKKREGKWIAPEHFGARRNDKGEGKEMYTVPGEP